MKHFVLLTLLLNCSIASAQSASLRETLVTIAQEKLTAIAQKNGHTLIQDSVHLSFAESNLLIPIGPSGFIVGAALMSAAAVRFPNHAGKIISIIGVTRGFKSSAIIRVITATVDNIYHGAAIGGTAALGITLVNDYGNHIFYVDHYRTELHYSLISEFEDEIIEGSCHFFSYIDDSDTLFYEIDNCSHDSIFPQEEEGILRIGSEADFTDEFFGQTNVVATGRTLIPSLLHEMLISK